MAEHHGDEHRLQPRPLHNLGRRLAGANSALQSETSLQPLAA